MRHGALSRQFLEGKIHNEVAGDFLQFLPEFGDVAGVGDEEVGLGGEEGFARHGRAATFGGEFLHVL